jgi:hypothetical protein
MLTATVLRHARDCDVVLDLEDLASVDEGGIGGLVELANALPPGAELTLLSPRPPVARAVERSGVLDAVPNLVLFFTHDPSAARRRWSELISLARAPGERAFGPLDRDPAMSDPAPNGNGSAGSRAVDGPVGKGHQRVVWLG